MGALPVRSVAVRPLRRILRLDQRPLPKYYTAEEIRKLIEAAASPRDELMLELLWQTGARITEALSLRPAAADFRSLTLAVPTLKRRTGGDGRIERIIPIQPALAGQLARYIADERIATDQRLFSISRSRAYRIVRAAARRAGLPRDGRDHPHTLRHSFGVHCVLAGVPVLVLNEWLGHANVENTLLYCRLVAADSRRFIEQMRW